MATRLLSVLCATLLVGAFALATLTAPDLQLGHALFLVDDHLLVTVQDHVQRSVPWLWDRVAIPMLTRPVWFIPAALGVICGGCAYSVSSRSAPRSRRRRS